MPYEIRGKTIYKKSGEKVGTTKGSVKKYMAALHANVPDSKNMPSRLGRRKRKQATA